MWAERHADGVLPVGRFSAEGQLAGDRAELVHRGAGAGDEQAAGVADLDGGLAASGYRVAAVFGQAQQRAILHGVAGPVERTVCIDVTSRGDLALARRARTGLGEGEGAVMMGQQLDPGSRRSPAGVCGAVRAAAAARQPARWPVSQQLGAGERLSVLQHQAQRFFATDTRN